MEEKSNNLYGQLIGYPIKETNEPIGRMYVLRHFKQWCIVMQVICCLVCLIFLNILLEWTQSGEKGIKSLVASGWWHVETRVGPNIFFLVIMIIIMVVFYKKDVIGIEEAMIKYIEPVVLWDTPCLISFYDYYFIVEQRKSNIKRRVTYKGSQWIKAKNHIICISDNILVKEPTKEIINLLNEIKQK